GGQNGKDALDDAGGRHDAQDRGQDAGNDVDKPVEGVKLLLLLLAGGFLGSGAVLIDSAAGNDMPHRAYGVVNVRHMVADDHHVLAAGLDNGHNAVGTFQHVGVGLALVLQLEAQAGDAVGERNDVGLAADVLDDDPRKTV